MSDCKRLAILALWALMSTLCSGPLQALGFGDIKLYSYLNEPLDAEIELVNVEDINLDQALVSLAPSADFEKIHLARPYFLSQLTFEVVKQGERTFISVRSDEVVQKAFLEFLVLLSWPEGRLVRSYTLLFDPAPLGRAVPRALQHQGAAIFDQHQAQMQPLRQRAQQSELLKTARLAQADLQRQAPGMEAAVNPHMDITASAHTDASVVIGNRSFEIIHPKVAAAESGKTASLEHLFEMESELPDLERAGVSSSNQAVSVTSSQEAMVAEAKVAAQSMPMVHAVPQPTQKSIFASWRGTSKKLGLSIWRSFKRQQGIWTVTPFLFLFAVWGLFWTWKRFGTQRLLPLSQGLFLKVGKKVTALFDPEFSTRLKLAQHYAGIQDRENARAVLEAMLVYGNQKEQKAAQDFLNRLESE